MTRAKSPETWSLKAKNLSVPWMIYENNWKKNYAICKNFTRSLTLKSKNIMYEKLKNWVKFSKWLSFSTLGPSGCMVLFS